MRCEACGFDFEETYGKELGEGFIEGHHTNPLSTLRRERKTKVTDIALVCSNCHRMLHRRADLTVEELREVLTRNGPKSRD